MNDLEKAIDLLVTGNYTCVICKENETHTSFSRGVSPLVLWYLNSYDFTGFSAADKVIGKATAFLYVALNVKIVYADVISESALELLLKNNIDVSYKTLVPNIINRKGNGICPFESAVLNIDSKETAIKIVINKMNEMNISYES